MARVGGGAPLAKSGRTPRLRPPGTKHTTVCAFGATSVGAGKLQTSDHESNKAFAAGVLARMRTPHVFACVCARGEGQSSVWGFLGPSVFGSSNLVSELFVFRA